MYVRMTRPSPSDLERLATELEGDLHFDATMRTLYATDASVYREMPQAVALPKTEADIVDILRQASEQFAVEPCHSVFNDPLNLMAEGVEALQRRLGFSRWRVV